MVKNIKRYFKDLMRELSPSSLPVWFMKINFINDLNVRSGRFCACDIFTARRLYSIRGRVQKES